MGFLISQQAAVEYQMISTKLQQQMQTRHCDKPYDWF